MAKSLAELQLAFKSQYPKEEQAQQVVLENSENETNASGKKDFAAIERPETSKEVVVEKVLELIKEPTKELKAQEEYQIDTSLVEEIKREKQNDEQLNKDKKLDKKPISDEKVEKQQVAEAANFEKNKKRNRASVVSDILFYAALIAMVVFAVLFSRGAFGEQTFGGFKFYEVLTTSMDSVYPRGSLVLIKAVDASELVVGDDITFARDSNTLITHRIVEIKEHYEGTSKRAFVTKGVDNAVADKEVVLADNVIGKVIKGFPGLGATFSLIGSNLWVVLILFLSLMALSFFLKSFWREQKKGKKIKGMENVK